MHPNQLKELQDFESASRKTCFSAHHVSNIFRDFPCLLNAVLVSHYMDSY